MSRMSPRRGFTLIELLVVIAIISALAGMALAGLSVLRRQQRVAGTLDLMTHITTAVDQYLRDYPRLGYAPVNFTNDPWEYLYKAQHRVKQKPLLELPLNRLVTKTGPGACSLADSAQSATHITDHFGSNVVNVFSFTLINHSKRAGKSFEYAQCIILRSSAGTQGDPKDDLIFAFNSEKASWRKLRTDELAEFSNELDPVPMPALSTEWKDPLSD